MRIDKQNDDLGSVGSYRWRAGSPFAPLRSPGADHGQGPENQNKFVQRCSGLMSWRRAARFRRTLEVVKRKPRCISAGPSSLERGSAASNRGQVDKSAHPDELTHISMINRR